MHPARIRVRQHEHGVLRVRNSRVMLDSVIVAFHLGHSAATIAQQYPALKLEEDVRRDHVLPCQSSRRRQIPTNAGRNLETMASEGERHREPRRPKATGHSSQHECEYAEIKSKGGAIDTSHPAPNSCHYCRTVFSRQ
jgi:hypothetical protein